MEKKIRARVGQSIDEVVDMLLSEKRKGNHVYCEFNDVILHSDDVTLDSAYLAICGCTKEEYEHKHFDILEKEKKPAKTSKELVLEFFAPTAENSIRDMKMSKLLFLTYNGEFYSSIAEEYIEKMSKYSIYCKEDEEVEKWTRKIRNLINLAGEVPDDDILSKLQSIEYTGIIMEQLANGISMDEIKKTVSDQSHTESTISLIGQNMTTYSQYGLEFNEQIVKPYMAKSKSKSRKSYKRELKKNQNSNLE